MMTKWRAELAFLKDPIPAFVAGEFILHNFTTAATAALIMTILNQRNCAI